MSTFIPFEGGIERLSQGAANNIYFPYFWWRSSQRIRSLPQGNFTGNSTAVSVQKRLDGGRIQIEDAKCFGVSERFSTRLDYALGEEEGELRYIHATRETYDPYLEEYVDQCTFVADISGIHIAEFTQSELLCSLRHAARAVKQSS